MPSAHVLSILSLLLIEIWKLLVEMFHFGSIVDGDVRVIRVKRRIVLMIGLCFVECFQRDDLRNDWSRE